MDQVSKLIKIIEEKELCVEIKQYEPMKNYTSFKIGGPVRLMLFPNTEDALVELCEICSSQIVKPIILGNGTNDLATDEAINRIVICTAKIKSLLLTEVVSGNDLGSSLIKASSGTILASIAVLALEHNLTGFEFAHGIPGSLGGAIVMNAGAYGGEMKDVVLTSTVYNPDCGLYKVSREKHDFSYRHSRFIETDEVIISSVIELSKGRKTVIKAKMDELALKRKTSQPLDMPSAGSTFKRPKIGYAAELIERADLKGYSIGDAQVSTKHSGFVVNKGNATFKDTMKLMDHIRETVKKKFDIDLEPEVKILR